MNQAERLGAAWRGWNSPSDTFDMINHSSRPLSICWASSNNARGTLHLLMPELLEHLHVFLSVPLSLFDWPTTVESKRYRLWHVEYLA